MPRADSARPPLISDIWFQPGTALGREKKFHLPLPRSIFRNGRLESLNETLPFKEIAGISSAETLALPGRSYFCSGGKTLISTRRLSA